MRDLAVFVKSIDEYKVSFIPFNASSLIIPCNASPFLCFIISGNPVFFTISERDSLLLLALSIVVRSNSLLVYKE